ncbi:flagellar basal body rod protein FlgB [Clostridia bacterium]|nr:flagellar basal body rod protein FlgB [Clostridia bacterium]
MLFDSMWIKNDILGSAMQASVIRNDVISNNIANAETPGYKKKAVAFETYLRGEIDGYEKTGKINLRAAAPSIYIEDPNFFYRIDENNVDIETEMVDLYENSVKYDVLSSSIMNNYKRINLAITGIR